MKSTIAARVSNLIIFAVSLIALLAVMGYTQRKDAADHQSAQQAPVDQKYDALQREGERMVSYELIAK